MLLLVMPFILIGEDRRGVALTTIDMIVFIHIFEGRPISFIDDTVWSAQNLAFHRGFYLGGPQEAKADAALLTCLMIATVLLVISWCIFEVHAFRERRKGVSDPQR